MKNFAPYLQRIALKVFQCVVFLIFNYFLPVLWTIYIYSSNLKRLITKAKFTEQKIKTSNKVFKCNRPNCALCECIEEGNCYISMVKFSMKKKRCLAM